MNIKHLLNKGYFPKELPPSFFTELFGNDFSNISALADSTKNASLTALQNSVNTMTGLSRPEKTEKKVRLKQIFKNRLNYSDCSQFNIPKSGIARKIIKIPNPIHQGKLSQAIVDNYTEIAKLFNDSNLSTTKPQIETEIEQNKRSVKHNDFSFFKESGIINSFKYAVQLKTDIAKFYPSIYTHSVPWVTFGGKDKYKRNRALSNTDPLKVNNIYGNDIDDRLMWCQNQQTMGIPIGPDTSFIIAEVIACHIDKHLEKKLKSKKIDFLGYRYYDDYALYFNSELDAQIGLSELKKILNDFELKINDEKTEISRTQSELEKPWALDIKSFYFRPSENDQKDDIWNFFSIAFRHAQENPKDSVLKLALNKFNFVRIEEENWDYFESLLFRLGLIETSSLNKIAKLLITYEKLVSKKRLKEFCFEIIKRNYENQHDFELTWSLWILNEFKIQPTKDIYEMVFKSKSVTGIIVGLDLFQQNNRIKNFDFTSVTEMINTDNLNNKEWLLAYETVYKDWIPTLSKSIIQDHFFFNILESRNIYFYNNSRKLEPLKVERSYLKKIETKLKQITTYISKNKFSNTELKSELIELSENLNLTDLTQTTDRKEIQKKLSDSDSKIKELIDKIEAVKLELKKFDKKKPYFVVGKRLEELSELTSKEIEAEAKQNKGLLFDPTYE
ncbi:reverse transcriptase (RNA-dependent DNA polymerase) [Maribacter spongiicola]|uniref:Reverse transcriptase (RNA-dependent DNA polymerase) n=1 Tax=Maribacter spongiicola TaxID=1206753 RepID=A0A4R7K4M2_9FLAO|nr:RNA-directed DNA polymerase [Maribacter spongiicola]TDT46157.1 reverse transcriptase (RNA-dependent DNA polymerase) [Maribacter spongiicola]